MVHRVEVMPPSERRRRYTDEEKARIVEKACAPGSSISAVARELGVSTSLIFTWRRDILGLRGAKPDDAAIATALREIREDVERHRRDKGTIRAPLPASIKERLTAVMKAGVSKTVVRAHTGVTLNALFRLCPGKKRAAAATCMPKSAQPAMAPTSMSSPMLVPVATPAPNPIVPVPAAAPSSPAIRELSIVGVPAARPRSESDARVSIKLGKLVSLELPVEALNADLLRALVEAGGTQ